MNVGVLGSGVVGRVLGGGFAKYRHQVMIGTRDSDKKDLTEWAGQTGAKTGSFEEAARFGEIIVLAGLGRAAESIIDLARPANFDRKTVIDAMNPLADGAPVNGVLKYTTGPNESLGEWIQAKLPNARVVKAFNSVGNAMMINPNFSQGTPTMFICGNDAQAKSKVGEIVRQFGWEPYDCGSIVSARALEPLCMLWCLPGFLNNEWQHAFKMLTH